MPKDMRIIHARMINRKIDSLGKSCNLALYEIKDIPWLFDKEDVLKQKENITSIKNIELNGNQTIKFNLTIAPKIKLFNIMQELFKKDEAIVRCLNIERKDFYVVKNDRIFSPMEDA